MGLKYGYYSKPSKSHLIVKGEHLDKGKVIFKGSEVKITKNGWQKLGSAIESKEFQWEYIESKVNKWTDQLIHFSKTAEIEPQPKVILHNFLEHSLIFMNIFSL